MAIELELNQPPPPTYDEREALNRTRTWLNCYCVDGSHATQYGKLPMLSLDDYLARNSREWYRSSPMNTPYDIHLCAYVQILMQLAHWREYMKHEGDCSTKVSIFRRNLPLTCADIVIATRNRDSGPPDARTTLRRNGCMG